MTPAQPWSSVFRDSLATALAQWLPARRWFGRGDRRVIRLDLVRIVELVDHSRYGGPLGVLVIVAAHLASDVPGEPDDIGYYQIPLGLRPVEAGPWLDRWALSSDLIAQIDGALVYDATADRELMTVLLALIAHGQPIGGVRFTAEVAGSLAMRWRAGLTVRRNGAEQSNTSMVYGNQFILKLYRRLAVGANPELEVHRRLRAVDDPNLATLHGAIETDIDAGPVTLGILHSFAAVAVDGWELATAAARSAIAGDPTGADIRPALRELGATVATVHARLAAAFGSTELAAPTIATLRTHLRARLSAAARAAPALREYLTPLGELVDAAAAQPHDRIQRIHGDLHLGQALRTPTGWLMIDFEGEPGAPIDQRVLWRSPLQDVAGVLRSLDYAAGHVLLSHPAPANATASDLAAAQVSRLRAAEAWVAGARDSFWQGYADVTGAGPIARSRLLPAYEADKAVYEVVYETRNRPGWIPIPMRAIQWLADSRMRTEPAQAVAPVDPTGTATS